VRAMISVDRWTHLRLSWTQKEAAVLIAGMLVAIAFPATSPTEQTLYQAYLIADFDQIRHADNESGILPSLAIDRVPNGSPAQGFYVIPMPPSKAADYPLNDIQVRCTAAMPEPLSVSFEEFVRGLRDHCRFLLPDHHDANLMTHAEVENWERYKQQRFYFETIPTGELLVRCESLLPRRVTDSEPAFSKWIRKHCSFATRWTP